MKSVSYIVVGAGSRGTGYAGYALQHPEQAEVVGVAEPREPARHRLVTDHDIAPDNVYTDWREIAARPKFADAAVITTQDAMHVEPAIALAEKGYHLLLEKPTGLDLAELKKIRDAVTRSGVSTRPSPRARSARRSCPPSPAARRHDGARARRAW